MLQAAVEPRVLFDRPETKTSDPRQQPSAASRCDGEHYRANADAVMAYLVKAADTDTGRALALPRLGEGGPIIGKRAGWT
jgi:hypothetical protein